jgi:hypothetical protein
MKVVTKGFVVSLLVFNCILFSGGLLLRHSEAGVQASTTVAFVVGQTVLWWFDKREGRPTHTKR